MLSMVLPQVSCSFHTLIGQAGQSVARHGLHYPCILRQMFNGVSGGLIGMA